MSLSCTKHCDNLALTKCYQGAGLFVSNLAGRVSMLLPCIRLHCCLPSVPCPVPYQHCCLHRSLRQDCLGTGLVLVLTLFMAAASGLGGVPYFFVRSFSKEYSALASAVACGVMLAASFDLVHEGQPYGANMVILGVLSGEASSCC